MRRALSHCALVATAAVMTSVLLPGGVASAENTRTSCSEDTSVAYTPPFGVLGTTDDQVLVDHPTPTRVVVCFRFFSLGFGGVTVVADVAAGPTLPVAFGTNSALCTDNPLLTFGNLRLATTVSSGAVCLTLLDGSTITVQFVSSAIPPSNLPALEVWRDGGPGTDFGWIDVAACPVEYAEALLGGPLTCMQSNDRIYP